VRIRHRQAVDGYLRPAGSQGPVLPSTDQKMRTATRIGIATESPFATVRFALPDLRAARVHQKCATCKDCRSHATLMVRISTRGPAPLTFCGALAVLMDRDQKALWRHPRALPGSGFKIRKWRRTHMLRRHQVARRDLQDTGLLIHPRSRACTCVPLQRQRGFRHNVRPQGAHN